MGSSFTNKCDAIEKSGGIRITDETFVSDMVCVVDNGYFAACGYAYDEREYNVFKSRDGRQKQWYVLSNVESHIDKD